VYSMQNDTTTAAVLKKLSEVIARFGLPQQIVTDNARQFTSEEFMMFCKSNSIAHVRSSPYHPRSNGEAERFVRTFKEGMKAKDLTIELRLNRFLFQYRATPHATTGVSSAELLQGRKLRTLLDLVRPGVLENVAKAQERQERGFNKRVKLREFLPDQEVWVKTYSKNEEKWSFGKIVRALGPVTFLVQLDDRRIKRHMDQIRAATRKAEEVIHSDIAPVPEPMPSPRRSPKQSPVKPNTPEAHAPDAVPPITTPVRSPEAVPVTRPRRNPKPVQRYGNNIYDV